MSLSRCVKLIAPRTEYTVRWARAARGGVAGLPAVPGAPARALLSRLGSMLEGAEKKKTRTGSVLLRHQDTAARLSLAEVICWFTKFRVAWKNCPVIFCRESDIEMAFRGARRARIRCIRVVPDMGAFGARKCFRTIFGRV